MLLIDRVWIVSEKYTISQSSIIYSLLIDMIDMNFPILILKTQIDPQIRSIPFGIYSSRRPRS